MTAIRSDELEFSEAWYEDEEGARWSSGSGHGPSAGASSSGSSILRVPPRCRLPRHTDSAEETIVVFAGRAEVEVDGHVERVGTGDIVLVPKDTSHEVRNDGEEELRFAAVYAAPDVTTTYERPVQPDGETERSPFE